MSWRLLVTWDASPEFAMGLDEALLADAAAPPTLRLYTWAPDTLSLGYFQRPSDVPGAERAGALVRRLTGGGAIHHARELTFSLTTAAGDPLYRGPVAGSYERVHRAIAAALAAFGAAASLRGAETLASEREGTGMCFHRSSPLDLAWNGRKGLGSAQRRRGGRVLHHGSLKLAPTELDSGVASLVRPGGAGVEPRELAPVLAESIDRALGLDLRPGAPSAAELRAARELGRRYVAPEWVHARD